MPRPITIILASLVIALVLYLLFWPTDIDPKHWQAPKTTGYVAPYTPNHALKQLDQLPMPGCTSPETIVLGPDNHLYASMLSGEIMRFDADGTNPEVWFKIEGRVLGMDFDNDGNLIVADSYHGLFKITADKNLEALVTTFEEKPLLFVNSVVVSTDDTIYFTDSTTRYPADYRGHTLATSVIDLFDHQNTGRLLAYHPDTQQTELLTQGYTFANGVALDKDEQFILFAETGNYCIHRHWLQGEKKGQTERFLENFPGFPDNLSRAPDNTFWVALVAPRNALLDFMADKPFLRKIVWRLPDLFKPKAVIYSHVIRFDASGQVLQSLQEPEPINPIICGVLETETMLFFHSLDSETLLCLKKNAIVTTREQNENL